MKLTLSIRQQLLLLVMMLAVPLSCLFIYDTLQDVRDNLAYAEETSATLSSIISSDVSAYILSRENVLARIAEREQVRLFDPANCDPILRDFRSFDPNFSNIIVIQRNGKVICSAIPLNDSISYANSENFQRVFSSNALVIGKPVFGRISQRWILPLNYPVRDDNNTPIGSIGAPIDLYEYTPVSEELNLPFQSMVMLVNRGGTIVSTNKSSEKYVGVHIDEMFEGLDIEKQSGTTSLVTKLNGVKCILRLLLSTEQTGTRFS